jgi:hypothetical protein
MGTDWIECLDKRPTDRTGHDLVILNIIHYPFILINFKVHKNEIQKYGVSLLFVIT